MTKVVECKVTDDGVFSFPAVTQIEMGDSFDSTTLPVLDLGVSISRVVTAYSQQGNAVLVLRSTSSD